MEQDHAALGVSEDEGGRAAAPQSDGLLGRIEVIESQPLEQRAAGFDQLAEELLAELQRSDGLGAPSDGEDVQ